MLPITESNRTATPTAREDYLYRAIRVGEALDIKGISESTDHSISQPHSFALYKHVKDDTYYYLLNYGVVVFCNADAAFVASCLAKWHPFIIHPAEQIEDDLVVRKCSDNKLSVAFDGIQLGRFDDEVNRMIMLHLAQSVVLDHFFYASQALLTSIKEHTEYMQLKGEIRLGQRDTLKFIGKTLSAKNHIAENLYILDSLEQAWEDEFLELLHARLKKHLDQTQRYKVIENTLRIVDENLSIYASYNNHRESSRLEWIIIILIVIEVVDTIVSKFF